MKKGNGSNYLTKERLIRLGTDKNGYKIFVSSIDSERRTFRTHRLVAEAFIPNPDNLPLVNHIDGNPSNNHVSNLEWCSHSHNTLDAVNRGVMLPTNGEKNGMAVLNEKKVLEIREKYSKQNISQADLAREYGINPSAINKIIKRQRWKHI